MNINVSIERLVLDGLPIDRTQGALVQVAVETELARLLAQQGLNHTSAGAVPYLGASSIDVTRDSRPAQVGHQVAKAIYSSLTPAPVLTHEIPFPGGSHR